MWHRFWFRGNPQRQRNSLGVFCPVRKWLVRRETRWRHMYFTGLLFGGPMQRCPFLCHLRPVEGGILSGWCWRSFLDLLSFRLSDRQTCITRGMVSTFHTFTSREAPGELTTIFRNLLGSSVGVLIRKGSVPGTFFMQNDCLPDILK